jgi:hypothetical protein
MRELNEDRKAKIKEIEDYLKSRGAISDWKKLPKW